MSNIILFAFLVLSFAIKTPTHSDILYVTVGETFKKTTAEFFGINEKWSFAFQGDQPTSLSFDNRDFVPGAQAQAYLSDVKKVIISKPYTDYHNYQLYGQFAFLNLNDQGAYELGFNTAPSSTPIFDKKTKLTIDQTPLQCFDFDFYSSTMVVVLCTSKDQQNEFSFHMLQVDLVTDQRTTKIIVPAKVYTEITKVKFQIVHQTQYTNTKFIYLAVPAYHAATLTYEIGSVIERYIMRDDLTILFDSKIDGASFAQFYTGPTQLSLVDFLVIGESTYVLDKDTNGDFAFIYVVAFGTPAQQQSLKDKIPPTQIDLKSGQSAFFDGSLTFLHFEDIFTSAKMYYTSIIFKNDEQLFSHNPQQLPVYSQILYEDQGTNIIGKITQNYKLILDTHKNTLQVQNLYTKSYEKFIQFDENVYGLLVDQYTDSFIILFKQRSQRYQIQEPYVLSVPMQTTEIKKFTVSGTYKDGVQNTGLTYQVLAGDDQKLYIQAPLMVTLEAKFWTDFAMVSQPIVTSGPNPFVEYSAGLTTKLTAYSYLVKNLYIGFTEIKGRGIHATKQQSNGYWIINQEPDLSQQLLFCWNTNGNTCSAQNMQFQKRDTIGQYQFSQSGTKIDFALLFDGGLDIYNNQKFEATLTPADRILSYFLTGEQLVTADGKNVLFYIYQIQDVVRTYTINQELMAQLGYDKVFEPKQIFMNQASSPQFLILNSNQDLIVGKYDATYTIKFVIQIIQGAKISIGISQNGFVLLQYGTGIQRLSQYIIEQGVYKLVLETTISEYVVTSGLAYDIETCVFAVNALHKNDPVLLVFDPSRQWRDQLIRVIPILKANALLDLQLVSINDQIKITGFIGEELVEYSVNRYSVEVKAETLKEITTFTSQDAYLVHFQNPYSKLEYAETLKAELYFNKIWANKSYSSNDLPRVSKENNQIIKLPNDLFMANIFQYNLRCSQCSNKQIDLLRPLQMEATSVVVGQTTKCLYDNEIYVCINYDKLRTLDKDSKLIRESALDGTGTYIYRLGSTSIYLVSMIGSVRIYNIEKGIITQKGSSNLLMNYKDQLVYSDSRIITFHYNQYQVKDGYQILDLITQEQLILNTFVPMAGIKSFDYEPIEKYIVTSFENSQLITQSLDLSQPAIQVGQQTIIQVMDLIQKQGINIIDLQITYVVNVPDVKNVFLIYDIDGTGYKFDIKAQKVLNIYPSPNNQQGEFESVQITNEFIVVSRRTDKGSQISLYNYDKEATQPNNKPSLMIQGLKTVNLNCILRKTQTDTILQVQLDNLSLQSYKVTNEIAIIIKDGENFQNQNVVIDVDNHFERSSLEKQLSTTSSSSSSDAWIYILVSLAVVGVGGGVGYFMYKRHKRNQKTQLLY